jgi:hypothetical protein
MRASTSPWFILQTVDGLLGRSPSACLDTIERIATGPVFSMSTVRRPNCRTSDGPASGADDDRMSVNIHRGIRLHLWTPPRS